MAARPAAHPGRRRAPPRRRSGAHGRRGAGGPRPARPAARDEHRRGRGAVRRSWPPSTRPRTAGSCWPGWPAATGSRAIPTWPPYVERFVLEGQSARLSAAALETLAIVAYKQPVSRAQVSAIRGVNVDAVMRTLDQRGLHRGGRPRPGPRPGRAVRHDAVVPREARARLAGRASPPGRVRPGGRRGRGPRARPATGGLDGGVNHADDPRAPAEGNDAQFTILAVS